ncbi:ABC transporter ATP-binding protein [Paraglaciecola polaris]|uniref:Hemin import ATP-binding protein HmuV n=1 Tax=Paraglaciecola polaris LMG 21857 TaxID=1129793 RepID=K6YKE6_9ALTE|nr:ABC transporter ATP-binding protein [Paraglaciecola polaris]GAC33184.1 hemin import ATP-binding protein HmuV [Paraglaciecola polaris LMG 21857]|tara:strand:+ start:3286 stop:4074 length:789 start_codon:yes stop_codon:yes gene_type:complete
MLNLQNISLSHGAFTLLDGLNLSLSSGDFMTVIGENGCGKSTLLRCIAGLHASYSGNVTFGQRSVDAWPAKLLAKARAFVNQHNQVQFAFLTEEVLQLGRINQHENLAQSSALICQVAEQLSIGHLFGRDVRTLSGGERQRVFIAKALVQLLPNANEAKTERDFEGKLLLLDEPTSALDFRFQKAMMDVIKGFCQQGLGVMCVSHDINLVLPYATHVILLANGRCLAQGSAGSVITAQNLHQCFGVMPKLIPQANSVPYITH